MSRVPLCWKISVLIAFAAAQSVTALAQTCATPPAGLAAWFPGDGNALDLQGGDSGTLFGGATTVTFVPGKVSQALQFNGGGDIEISDEPSQNPTSGITL